MKNIKIEDYRENPKLYKEVTIPKGYRLLKMQEVIDLMNSGKFEVDKNRWRQFFFEQPFDKNFKSGYKVAVLNSYDFVDGLVVGADYYELYDYRYSFGVFIKQ